MIEVINTFRFLIGSCITEYEAKIAKTLKIFIYMQIK